MHVRAGRFAGGTDEGDDLALADALAGSDGHPRKVRVPGVVAVLVVDVDFDPESAVPAGEERYAPSAAA